MIKYFIFVDCTFCKVMNSKVTKEKLLENASKWSDIDIAVILTEFSDDLFEERVALMRIAARIDDRIEPYPFLETTFNSNNPLRDEIGKHDQHHHARPEDRRGKPREGQNGHNVAQDMFGSLGGNDSEKCAHKDSNNQRTQDQQKRGRDSLEDEL